MSWLLALAILTNAADAAQTCRALARDGRIEYRDGVAYTYHMREWNPLMPSSCRGVVAVKAATFAPLVVLNDDQRRWWTIGLAVGGGVGVTVTYVWGKR